MDVAVIRTRPATADDDAFLRDLFALTHFSAGFGPPADDPVWDTLLDVQYRARVQSWARRHPGGQDRIIAAGGDEVGRVWTAPDRDSVRIVDIALFPRAQGRGIGTAVLTELQSTARSLVLSVATDNRGAAALYHRLGFRKEGGDVMYSAMRWTAS